jgi:beta-galactosidase
VFDATTGLLLRIGDLDVTGPRLDLWRAPTDNEQRVAFGPPPLADVWRAAGLHRLEHRVFSVEPDAAGLLVKARMAPAGADFAMLATYRWHTSPVSLGSLINPVSPAGTTGHVAGPDSAQRHALWLELSVMPIGAWPCPLPRIGVRMTLPATIQRVEWFGLGPGEAYPDTSAAVRVGRHAAAIDDLQTPYMRPQENGNRRDVRWAKLTGAGTGLLITGEPRFDLTVRRWTTEDLDAATHTHELHPRDRVYLNLDAAHQGIGSASCGPGVLPQHRLAAQPTQLTVGLSPY